MTAEPALVRSASQGHPSPAPRWEGRGINTGIFDMYFSNALDAPGFGSQPDEQQRAVAKLYRRHEVEAQWPWVPA